MRARDQSANSRGSAPSSLKNQVHSSPLLFSTIISTPRARSVFMGVGVRLIAYTYEEERAASLTRA